MSKQFSEKMNEYSSIADAMNLQGQERYLFIEKAVAMHYPEHAKVINDFRQIEKENHFSTTAMIQMRRLKISAKDIFDACREEGMIKEECRKNSKGDDFFYYTLTDQGLRYGYNKINHAGDTVIMWTEAGFDRVCELWGFDEMVRDTISKG